MGKIARAIVMSDVHLGEEDGYLFSKSPGYEANRRAVAEVLDANKDFDELVLNGDILELAMAGLDVVYSELKLFFRLLAERGNIKRIVFLPGNHDHHLWRTLGEMIHVHGRLVKGETPPAHGDYSSGFVNQRFSSLDPDHAPYIVFPHLWPADAEAPEFIVKYPHHLLKIANGNYLISHGHFLESLFKPVNFLIEPNRLAQLEAFNNLWLEAFNYHLGHADDLSLQARELEDQFIMGGKEAKEKVQGILDAIYENMKRRIGFTFPVTCIVKFALKRIVREMPKEKMGQSKLRGAEVDQSLFDSIKKYIEKYIISRYSENFTFVFGHTHIPFSDRVQIRGRTYPIINTGGWLRKDGDASGSGKYAGLVIIDDRGARWESLQGKLK
jgi:metallophosphoesterase superfamily enzyme